MAHPRTDDRVTAPSRLDAFLPQPAHRSRFHTDVAASFEQTWAAMWAITPRDLPVTRALSAARAAPGRLLGSGHGGPADAPDRPVVEQFVAAGFGILDEDSPRTLVVGAAAQPWRLRGGSRVHLSSPGEFLAFDRPEHVRIALSFELVTSPDGRTRLATETRVTPTDAAAARAFGRYWTVIRLGGHAIRLDLLRGIRHLAEDMARGDGAAVRSDPPPR